MNLLGEAPSYIYTHMCTHIFLWSVCVYVGVVSVCGPPTWIEPGLVQSTAVSFERPKTKKGLKSRDLPLSCVHLIPLFLTLLSLHSALWPEAAACYCTEFNLWSPWTGLLSLNVSEREKKNFRKRKLQLDQRMNRSVVPTQFILAADVKGCGFLSADGRKRPMTQILTHS